MSSTPEQEQELRETIHAEVIALIKSGKIKLQTQLAPAAADAVVQKAIDAITPTVEAAKENAEKLIKSFKLEIASNTSLTKQVDLLEAGKVVKSMTGLFHCQFPDVLKRVQLNAAVDRGVWLWGAKGGGKTTLAKQVSDALGTVFVPIYGSKTLTDTKLIGYKNASNGAFVEGTVYQAYASEEAQEKGALLFIDEADEGEFLVTLNGLLANKYYRFPNGKIYDRPKRLYIMAAANTVGTGSKDGYRRSVQDGAALDRFTPFKLTYDIALERQVAGCPAVSDWVVKCRKHADKHLQGFTLSPRQHFALAEYVKGGIDPKTAVLEAVLSTVSNDVAAGILSAVGLPEV